MLNRSSHSSSPARSSSGFALMHVLVIAAILLVLIGVGIPVYSVLRQNSLKADTLTRMTKLAAAAKAYSSQNGDMLPREDARGDDTWQAAADPANADAWYNALPKLAGGRSVGEYASSPSEFYQPSNLLFVPGADYPIKKQLAQPYFAIAINTKLQRKDAEGQKARLKVSDIVRPSRTVLFLEQGLPGEARSMAQQTKKDYDGASKGSAKSFVARYRKTGWLMFVDGHAEAVPVADVLTETARFPFPVGSGDVIWTRSPDEDPNK